MNFLFITCCKQFDYGIRCNFLHVSWGLLSLTDEWVYSFHQMWKISAVIFSSVSALLQRLPSDRLSMRLCEVGPALTNALLLQTVSLCASFYIASSAMYSSSVIFLLCSMKPAVNLLLT